MKVFSFFYNLILIILGCMLAAFGTSCFLLPNQLSSGGFAGLATLTYYFFNIQMGFTIIVLNIPLFILAFFRLGVKFTFKTIIATILYSKFIDLFEGLNIAINDRLLASIYGGVFIGVGLAIIFKTYTSTGGTDLIAYLAQNYNIKMSISNLIMFIDIAVVVFNLIAFRELDIGLYSAIAIFIIGKMIDIVFEGINFCKMIYIISDEYEKIVYEINKEVKRGATGIYGKGSYTGVNKMIAMCVAKRKDIEKIKSICKQIDSNAFIIVTDAREVYGLGFKLN